MYSTRRPANRHGARWSRTIADARGVPECIIWREHRVACDWSQEQIAVALGVTRNTVHRWETGESWPRGHVLERYVQLLAHIGTLPAAEAVDGATRRGRPVT